MNARLPVPGSDDNTWGNILNAFLSVSHNSDGTIQSNAIEKAGAILSVNGKTSNTGSVSLTANDVGALTQATADGRYLLAGDAIMAAVNDTGGQVFNVKAYGAKGDGTTDDSAAITNALNAAAKVGSGIIYFPTGIYISSTEQDIPSNTVIMGEGYSSVVRRRTGNASYLVNVFRINAQSNVRITNIHIDGQKDDIIANYESTAQDVTHEYYTCCGVYVTGPDRSHPSTNITVDHCWIHDAYYGNVQPDNVDGMVITSNYLYYGRDNQINARVNAAGSGTCSHVTVSNNIVYGQGPITTKEQFSGIQFIRSTYITITGNVCYGFGNTVSGEGNGIGLEGSRHVVISGNVCSHNLFEGIKTDNTVEGWPPIWDDTQSYTPGDSVNYQGNDFVSATYNTSAVPPASPTSSSDWTYHTGGPPPQKCLDVTVTGNTCANNNYFATYGAQSIGIFIQNAESVTVESNQLYGNYLGFENGQGVTSLTIRGNFAYNNQSTGIALHNSLDAYGPFVISDNQVARNGSKGIDVVVPASITNNVVQNNNGAGICLNIVGTVVQPNPFFLIADNICIDNTDDGILVDGGFSSAVPVDIRNNYAPTSNIQPRLIGENGTPVRCTNNRTGTQAIEPWYFTNPSSIWIDEKTQQIIQVTGDYTVGTDDQVIFVTPAANSTITLPAPSTTRPPGQSGRTISIAKVTNSTNTVTVTTAGGAINGTTIIASNTSARYISDGTNWNMA